MSMLNSISPSLARLYSTNYLVQINVLFWGLMPITLLLFIVLGAGLLSWIPAVWVTVMIMAVMQGKEHSGSAVSSGDTPPQNNLMTSPSVPSSNPQSAQGTIVQCKVC